MTVNKKALVGATVKATVNHMIVEKHCCVYSTVRQSPRIQYKIDNVSVNVTLINVS